MGIFDFLHTSASQTRAPLYFFNTLTGDKQEFVLPQHAKNVRMYNCGPTVYGRQHIGNLSMFVFTDVLRKTLEYNDFTVKQTINITDFGHLTSDADEGEDKMVKGLKREKLKPTMANMKVLGEKYTNLFLEDIRALNVDVDHTTFPRASDYIPAQIAMIQALEEKSYAYRAEDGVYYDTSRFPAYGALGNINLTGQKEGARVAAKATKRNPIDFILWKFDKKMGWDSPWGKGFPGWHIECSAMARATLGEQLDIHTGGIEHIPIHHNNEIAQSEAATGKKPFARFWLHRAHIQIDGGKIAKSEGTVIYLSDIIERGFHPLALRYLFLGAHYRTPMNFTWEALAAAQTAFGKLVALRTELHHTHMSPLPRKLHDTFIERINDDLDTPGALAQLWEIIRDKKVSEEIV
ncbi:MAG: cysteine--tRNA ligase, partial [bacterium]|nr:cysteine--tRNA ligase [bacterium]